MNPRQNRLLLIAMLASFALHVALVWGVRNLPIGRYRLLMPVAAQPLRQFETVSVERSLEDLILGDVDALAAPGPNGRAFDPAVDPHEVTTESKNLLENVNVDPSAAPQQVPPAQQLSPADIEPQVDKPRGEEPNLDTPALQPSLTRKMLSLAKPSVALPEFVEETDTVKLPTPKDIAAAPGARIGVQDLAAIDRLLGPQGRAGSGGSPIRSGVPGTGDGLGVGRPGSGIGTAKSALDEAATPPIAPRVDPLGERPAPIKLPPLPDLVAKPAPIADADAPPAIHLDDDFAYSLHTYRQQPGKDGGLFGLFGNDAPKAVEPGWFEVRIAPQRSLRRLKPLYKDVVYVVDTSESIGKPWIAAIRQGVAAALDNLNEGDRFNLMLFKEDVKLLNPEGVIDATPQAIESARRMLDEADASGWTDVNQALSRLVIRQTGPDRVYQIILVSDGIPTRGAIDARRIINMITRENDLVGSIFCVGVGGQQNRQLLDYLAYRNKGFVIYPAGIASVSTDIRELAGRLRYPVVKDAAFDILGVDRSSIYPRIGRDIYQGDTLSFFGRFDAEQRLSMRLTGRNGEQTLDLTFTLPFASAQQADPKVAHDWAFWKLHDLYDQMLRGGKTPAIEQQMKEIESKYKIRPAY